MNPFIIRGYQGNTFFCDREKETEAILQALHNGRDMTLVSLRKMGKTGLLLHVFEKLKREKEFETIYLDIYHTENLNGMINQLATAVFRLKKSFGERMKEFLSTFRYVRPIISVDPQSGQPSISFQIADEHEARSTLEDLFGILRQRSLKKPVVVAIDEFQQIAGYPEKNVEALIRGLIQTLSNTRFIFSGSNKSILSRMFGDATRPFYQSTEMIYLSEIPRERYSRFISSHFKKDSRQVEEGAIDEILSWCRGHTWYVQYFCNKLFETGSPITHETLFNTRQEILLSYEPFYSEYRNLLTRHQWELLKAISRSDKSDKLTSGDFIRTNNLTNASTVKRGVVALFEKEMIFRTGDQYVVYDVFFSRWLEGG
ncbi:MAG: ATP-binding protein [Bacteroidales bacterium]|nr:ATP-binding protein [Bacteroidales bacterium]